MAKSNVTLKEIARLAGVSTTTVHRVLNDKEGCGEELKARILGIAKELGYSVNVSASALRKKTSHIALVFPQSRPTGHFFMDQIAAGYLRCKENLMPCNVEFHEFFYDYDEPDSLCPVLKAICQDEPVRFDGIALWSNSVSNSVMGMLNRLRGKGIPLVMMERATEDPELYDCYVGADDQLVGSMAGELISKMAHRGGKVMIVLQDIGNPERSGEACAAQLVSGGRTDLEPVFLKLPMLFDIRTDEIQKMLEEVPDIVALYAGSARHTFAAVKALKEMDRKLDAVVGCEVFQENMGALQEGILSAVIHKSPQAIGYMALQLLYNRVIKNEPMPKQYLVMPMIALDTNKNAVRGC